MKKIVLIVVVLALLATIAWHALFPLGGVSDGGRAEGAVKLREIEISLFNYRYDGNELYDASTDRAFVPDGWKRADSLSVGGAYWLIVVRDDWVVAWDVNNGYWGTQRDNGSPSAVIYSEDDGPTIVSSARSPMLPTSSVPVELLEKMSGALRTIDGD
jgi:hypothetical protein